jgi:hypothetical protein
MSGVAVQKHETYPWLPQCYSATLEALTRSLVVYLDPATTDPWLNANANGSPGVVPIDGPRPPPSANFFSEDREGCNGVDGNFDGGGDNVSRFHVASPF